MSWAETLGALPPLGERRTAAGHVADTLRAAIRSGQLGDGAELNQVALAEHFGVSRVPVREALRALEAEGWITARAHRRAFVQPLGVERVHRDLRRPRAARRPSARESDRRRSTPPASQRLRALCEAMDLMDDHAAWLAANRDFHRLAPRRRGAPLTVELLEQSRRAGRTLSAPARRRLRSRARSRRRTPRDPRRRHRRRRRRGKPLAARPHRPHAAARRRRHHRFEPPGGHLMSLPYRRNEVKERSRAGWHGPCNVTLPSFTTTFDALNAKAIEHDVAARRADGLLGNARRLRVRDDVRRIPAVHGDRGRRGAEGLLARRALELRPRRRDARGGEDRRDARL